MNQLFCARTCFILKTCESTCEVKILNGAAAVIILKKRERTSKYIVCTSNKSIKSSRSVSLEDV